MDGDMRRWAEARPGLIAGMRVFGALLLSYAFLIMLMTATAQSQVAARLGELTPKVGYSAGFASIRSAERASRDLAGLRKARFEAAKKLAATQEAEEQTRLDFTVLQAPIAALHDSRVAAPCQFGQPMRTDTYQIALAMREIRDCSEDTAMPAALRGRLRSAIAAAEKLPTVANDWQRLQRQDFGDQKALKDLDAELKFRANSTDMHGIRDAFSEMDALRARPYLGGDLVVAFPPSIVQVLLAFVSGMFGALLLTLVLIVYPKTQLDFSSAQGAYGARILLGGLIAVCVFIVLGGGTAVLGASNAFSSGEANFMAFAAVSVLAGMFSDRVAHWLSKRADSFFASADAPPADAPKPDTPAAG